MELLRIRGGRRLEGSVAISGSKNASLPVMAAALLTDQEVELGNVPDIEDISTMAQMLEHVGVESSIPTRTPGVCTPARCAPPRSIPI